jgi:hypothetical protein
MAEANAGLEAIRELVARWRRQANDVDATYHETLILPRCAKELEALLAAIPQAGEGGATMPDRDLPPRFPRKQQPGDASGEQTRDICMTCGRSKPVIVAVNASACPTCGQVFASAASPAGDKQGETNDWRKIADEWLRDAQQRRWSVKVKSLAKLLAKTAAQAQSRDSVLEEAAQHFEKNVTGVFHPAQIAMILRVLAATPATAGGGLSMLEKVEKAVCAIPRLEGQQ